MYFDGKMFYVFLPLFYLFSNEKLAVRLLYRASPVVWTAAEHVVITEGGEQGADDHEQADEYGDQPYPRPDSCRNLFRFHKQSLHKHQQRGPAGPCGSPPDGRIAGRIEGLNSPETTGTTGAQMENETVRTVGIGEGTAGRNEVKRRRGRGKGAKKESRQKADSLPDAGPDDHRDISFIVRQRFHPASSHSHPKAADAEGRIFLSALQSPVSAAPATADRSGTLT